MHTWWPCWVGAIALSTGCGNGSLRPAADGGARPDAANALVPSACIFNQTGTPQPLIQRQDPGIVSVPCLGRTRASVLSIQDQAGQGFDWKATVESPNGFFTPDPELGSACPGFVGTGLGGSGVRVSPPKSARPGDSDDGTLTIVTSAPSVGPFTAEVHAVVVATSFRVSPVVVDFSRVVLGETRAIALTVENTSTVPLLIQPTPTPTLPFEVQYWGSCSEDCFETPRLDPGQSGQMLTFVFKPAVVGAATLELDLTPFPANQDVPPECGSPVHVTLSGVGVAAPADAGTAAVASDVVRGP